MINTIQKTIVAWAFNQIAHYYFDNVNISQLHVALEKGEVELEDLIIKREALRHLKLPVDVTWGVVGKLTIKVPLLTILTDPRQVKINVLLEKISIHLANVSGLTRIYLEKCNLDIHDEASNSMQLVVVDCDKCLFYIVDDTTGPCAIPILEFSLEDFRILLVLGKNQRNGFIYGKLGCCYYNREVSTWDPFLDPWPFNLSWQFDLTEVGHEERKITHRKISLKSDELAEFYLTSAFLDICDVALLRVIRNFQQPKLQALVKSIQSTDLAPTHELNASFVLNNETGHKLHFAPLEQNNGLFEISDPNSSPTYGGDSISQPMHKLSINSRSSSSRDSPDLNRLANWTSVGAGERVSFETVPVYRKYVGSANSRSQMLLLRVEGWKTLLPIPIDRTGLFFREAFSDRVMNEDTYIAVKIELEDESARKLISVRSPINLVNLLDSTMEVHFFESNQAIYIKPNCHLAVPLPYIFDKMHIRPCNVGVTMSEKPLLWDQIRSIYNHQSRIHICQPITVTDTKHASYCTSQPYRVCVSIDRDWPQGDDPGLEVPMIYDLRIFSVKFMPPLTIVNLLPCEIHYKIGMIEGTLSKASQHKIHHVDTTRSTNVHFKMNNFPQSKPLTIDPGATGSFHHTLEMFDNRNRSLYLKAEVVMVSMGEELAVQIVVYAPFWFINKTRLPLIFKQEGAALEAAGQYREHEDNPDKTLIFSFYEAEQEPPMLCSMRLGRSKGRPVWCEGFKLEKGTGERRLCSLPNNRSGDSKMNKSLIDIDVRKGIGRYSRTVIATFTARYGFDPLTKTPKKATVDSPQNYKLTSYNHNVNLAERIAGQAVSLFNNHGRKATSDMELVSPGFKLTLIDKSSEKLVEALVETIVIKCNTKAREEIIDCSIQNIRIDNLMSECDKAVLLDRAINMDESMNVTPAIRLIMDRILGNSYGTTLFKQVQLSMCEFVVNIEERLILKLVEFINFKNRRQRDDTENLSNDLDKILHPEDDRHAKYYFDLLRIDLSSIKLSVYTSSNLNDSLQRLKSYLGLKFFGFEDAHVQLAPYFQMNISRNFKGIFESVTRFYKRQILEQAPRIVGQQIQNYLRFHLSDMLSTLYDEVYNKLFD